MKNKKGFAYFLPVTVLGAFHLAFLAIGLAAVWHIPAWTKAKHDHTEAAYQAQPMWPQTQIAQFANGKPSVVQPVMVAGNGGNFEGGMSS